MDFCSQMCGIYLLNKIKKEIEKGSDLGFQKNLLVSPLSFNAVLNMVAAGSTGQTFAQMTKFLACKSYDEIDSKFLELMSVASPADIDEEDIENGGPVVCVANGLWVDKEYPLRSRYQELVQSVYKAHAKTVDFVNQVNEVVEEANEWAKSATKGLVTNVLTPTEIHRDTKLILGNALHFRGIWADTFATVYTQKKEFHLLNGDRISAPFMTGCEIYTHGSYQGFEVVKIPYRRGKQDTREFSMFIFLPNETDGLQKLLEKATTHPGFFSQDFSLVSKRFDFFWIPKFKFEYRSSEAMETMKDMGLYLPFMVNCMELTRLVDTKEEPFFVSEIVQKAFIDVDETGTKAAVVTFPRLRGGGYRDPASYTRFVADHPFLFMIREENTKSVLVTGVVLNPLLE